MPKNVWAQWSLSVLAIFALVSIACEIGDATSAARWFEAGICLVLAEFAVISAQQEAFLRLSFARQAGVIAALTGFVVLVGFIAVVLRPMGG